MRRFWLVASSVAALGLGVLSFAGCTSKAPDEEAAPSPPAVSEEGPTAAETESVATPEAATQPEAAAEPETASTLTEEVTEAEPPAQEQLRPAEPGGLKRIPIEDFFVLGGRSEGNETLTVEEIKEFLSNPAYHEPVLPIVPLGLDQNIQDYIPSDNPLTIAKVELGRQLYFDARLSRDGTVSCATCHDPAKGFSDGQPVSTGINGQKGTRNAPTVFNRVYGKTQFWDGRAASLEEQALGPIQNPIEMGFTLDELVERLKGIEGYRIQFEKIFGEVSADAIAKAIASFERVILVGNSPYDYYQELQRFAKLSPEDLEASPELKAQKEAAEKAAAEHPMSEAAIRGMKLFFGKAECSTCHVGPNLTDELFWNIGVGMDKENPDLGRYAVTKEEKDKGAFKTPTVRNVTLNPPYMHDGSQATLMEVIEHYNKGGTPNKWLTDRMKPLNLTDQEKQDLVEFLKALEGEVPKIPLPRLPQ